MKNKLSLIVIGIILAGIAIFIIPGLLFPITPADVQAIQFVDKSDIGSVFIEKYPNHFIPTNNVKGNGTYYERELVYETEKDDRIFIMNVFVKFKYQKPESISHVNLICKHKTGEVIWEKTDKEEITKAIENEECFRE